MSGVWTRDCARAKSCDSRAFVIVLRLSCCTFGISKEDSDHTEGLGRGFLGLRELRKRFPERDVGIKVLDHGFKQEASRVQIRQLLTRDLLSNGTACANAKIWSRCAQVYWPSTQNLFCNRDVAECIFTWGV